MKEQKEKVIMVFFCRSEVAIKKKSTLEHLVFNV